MIMLSFLFLTTISLIPIPIPGEIVELWSAEHLDDLIVSNAYNRSVPASLPSIIAFLTDNDNLPLPFDDAI